MFIAPRYRAVYSFWKCQLWCDKSIDAWSEVREGGLTDSTWVVLVVEEALRERDLRMWKSRTAPHLTPALPAKHRHQRHSTLVLHAYRVPES